jgi:hypothetical protein
LYAKARIRIWSGVVLVKRFPLQFCRKYKEFMISKPWGQFRIWSGVVFRVDFLHIVFFKYTTFMIFKPRGGFESGPGLISIDFNCFLYIYWNFCRSLLIFSAPTAATQPAHFQTTSAKANAALARLKVPDCIYDYQ